MQDTVKIRIRHGSSLSLGRVKWFVSDKQLDCIYIVRHVLAVIGIDNLKLLSIACDHYNGHVDIEKAMQEAGNPNEPCAGVPAGFICGILRSMGSEYGSTFHSKGDAGTDFLGDTDVYVELGDDIPEELDACLKSRSQAHVPTRSVRTAVQI